MHGTENLELLDRQLSFIARNAENYLKRKKIIFNLEANDENQTIPCGALEKKIKLLDLMRSLPYYQPSNEMLKAQATEFTDNDLIVANTVFAEYLATRNLEFYNVCSVMQTLLTIEDLSNLQKYAQLIQENVAVQRVSKLKYKISLRNTRINAEEVVATNIDEVVLVPKSSLIASPLPKQLVLALFPHPHEGLPLKDPMRRHVASVEQVSRTTVHIRFSRGNCPKEEDLLGQHFYVIIRSKRTPIRYMYRALQLLQESPLVRRYLFPFPSWLTQMVEKSWIHIDKRANLPSWMEVKPLPQPAPSAAVFLLNSSIYSNMEQLQAVQRIVAGPSLQGPYILFGPPGTGKTTTIVEAILQLRLQQPRSRILVTAGSNSACDTIALKLCEYIHSNERLREHFAKQEQPKPDHQLIRVFSRSVHQKGLKSVPALLLKNSNCSKNIYEHFGVSHILKYGITVATLCTVGRLVTDKLGEHNFFSHIFIDEAGASTEPEALIGIIGIKQKSDCHVILSGDHKQLGAVIKSNRAASLGLSKSLMERLLGLDCYKMDENGNYDRTLQTRLRRNYRSHPQIVRLFNDLYYNGELISEAPAADVNLAANWSLLPNPNFPIIFQATHGVTQREQTSTSSYNHLEAQVLCWYVKRLINDGLGKRRKVSQEDIGIVAPYTAQGNLITKLLQKQGHRNVEVGSVETYQGREKPIILASLVKSFANMGFMRNPRRVNVLLSRAKALLILVGNPVTLRHHRDFKLIIKECKKQGTYLFKEKNSQQRPEFLADVEEEDSDDDSSNALEDYELTPWYARMPQNISVTLDKLETRLMESMAKLSIQNHLDQNSNYLKAGPTNITKLKL
ncbi:putative helicase MOV-10 [Drosophila eugracilis]|uniref:putative helicase MOV-10 n=1 Tax=Drosophila eugracilis TaxID=29029 RepID=UPI0007E706B5|nr:putative helicase MOV-10 [Drosophila eugracilis]XP_017077820.1 putative helicase MOV-10 [Drosophila eugracilis]